MVTHFLQAQQEREKVQNTDNPQIRYGSIGA